MLLPQIWPRRRKNVPVRSRIAQFRAVIRAAQSVEGYRERLRNAGLDSPKRVNEARDIQDALLALAPLPLSRYQSFFTQRKPAWRQVPDGRETRSVLMLPYAQAREGSQRCQDNPPASMDIYSLDHYSVAATVAATEDLRNLSRAIRAPSPSNWASDGALVVFCGIEAGLMSEDQREQLWEKYQVPLFQQFLGTDGRVIAAECEVHAGLHIHEEAAVIERLDGQLLITSLTDELSPALRMESGLYGEIGYDPCECGRVAPRIIGLRSGTRSATHPNAAIAAA